MMDVLNDVIETLDTVGAALGAEFKVVGYISLGLTLLSVSLLAMIVVVALWNLPAICRACAEEGRDEALKAADGGCTVAERRRVVAEIDRAAMAQEACR